MKMHALMQSVQVLTVFVGALSIWSAISAEEHSDAVNGKEEHETQKRQDPRPERSSGESKPLYLQSHSGSDPRGNRNYRLILSSSDPQARATPPKTANPLPDASDMFSNLIRSSDSDGQSSSSSSPSMLDLFLSSAMKEDPPTSSSHNRDSIQPPPVAKRPTYPINRNNIPYSPSNRDSIQPPPVAKRPTYPINRNNIPYSPSRQASSASAYPPDYPYRPQYRVLPQPPRPSYSIPKQPISVGRSHAKAIRPPYVTYPAAPTPYPAAPTPYPAAPTPYPAPPLNATTPNVAPVERQQHDAKNKSREGNIHRYGNQAASRNHANTYDFSGGATNAKNYGTEDKTYGYYTNVYEQEDKTSGGGEGGHEYDQGRDSGGYHQPPVSYSNKNQNGYHQHSHHFGYPSTYRSYHGEAPKTYEPEPKGLTLQLGNGGHHGHGIALGTLATLGRQMLRSIVLNIPPPDNLKSRVVLGVELTTDLGQKKPKINIQPAHHHYGHH